jgi:hypothetical protein
MPGSLPVSVGRIAFTVTQAAGTSGWRFPGIFGYQRLDLGNDMKLELALEIARAAWANPANPQADSVVSNGTTVGAGNAIGTDSSTFYNVLTDLGSASGLPQIEARAMLTIGKVFDAYVTGHWNNVDPSGWGVAPNPSQLLPCRASSSTPQGVGAGSAANCSDFQVYSANVGVRVALSDFEFRGNYYIGQNLAPLLGSILQFPTSYSGDLSEWGGWAQLGYNFTPELSLWALVGTEQVDQQAGIRDQLTNLQNTVAQGMIRYMTGGYAVAFEWTHFHTRTRAAWNWTNSSTSWDANQPMLSAFYFF